MYTKEHIIQYIDGAVLTWISIDDPTKYKIMRENLEGAINDLIDDGHIVIV